MKFRKFWQGDTLVEVTLAIGIFSMVAIAVVAVVSGSTSSAQTALETTVTREQIDIQAEAIRFIQNSYVAGGKTNAAGNELYAKLWGAIANQALNKNDFDKDDNNFLEYMPQTCNELYQRDESNRNTLTRQKAFVINTHQMALLNQPYSTSTVDTIINSILVRASSNEVKFQAAATYPRIVYTNNKIDEDAGGESVYDEERYDAAGNNGIEMVEGLYVVAVKDNESSTVVSSREDNLGEQIDYKTAAYYDFYIRTCWYGPGANRPSTISTVIRLQDPDVIDY